MAAVLVHAGRRRRLRCQDKRMSPAPPTMAAPPAATSMPRGPGPSPPPVAGAPAGAPVVAFPVADVAAPVAVLVGVAPPAGAGGHGVAAVVVLAGVVAKETGVHACHVGCSPGTGSHAIGVPLAAIPDSFSSATGQNSPAL